MNLEIRTCFLFSFLTFIGLYTVVFGWRFGVGFAVSILIHELGHYVDIKRMRVCSWDTLLPKAGPMVRRQSKCRGGHRQIFDVRPLEKSIEAANRTRFSEPD